MFSGKSYKTVIDAEQDNHLYIVHSFPFSYIVSYTFVYYQVNEFACELIQGAMLFYWHSRLDNSAI